MTYFLSLVLIRLVLWRLWSRWWCFKPILIILHAVEQITFRDTEPNFILLLLLTIKRFAVYLAPSIWLVRYILMKLFTQLIILSSSLRYSLTLVGQRIIVPFGTSFQELINIAFLFCFFFSF